jgi:hypothetical protein
LAATFLPPPINGGSDAGDVVFNSNINWQINTQYDVETVAIHEIGHALGMSHSQITTAVMYAYYIATKQSLTSDDTAGIQSIYGTRQYDQFNSNGRSDGSYTRAVNVSSYIDGNGQVAIPGLDITTVGQSQWFSVTVPSTTTGTMVATAQSSNLSSLSPKVTVYTSSLTVVGTAGSTNLGDTVSVSISGVQPGQTYLVRAAGNGGGNVIGGFGLELNFGNQYQPPIPPPNTVVTQQPDQGGGSMNHPVSLIKVGNLVDFGETLTPSGVPQVNPPGPPLPPSILTGSVVMNGDQAGALINDPSANAAQTQVLAVSAAPNLVLGQAALPVVTPVEDNSVLQALDTALASWNPKGVASLLG